MRTFVAVELDAACRRALAEALGRLKSFAAGVRWVQPDALHLTLKFIGDLPEADLPAAVECLGGAAAAAPPFTMTVSGLSGFPPRGAPRVIHVGVQEESGALAALQRAVEDALEDRLGIAREGRPYVPHITFGRARDPRRCPPTEEICAAVAEQSFGRVEVDSFVLMRSDLKPGGPVYTPLHRFPLTGRA